MYAEQPDMRQTMHNRLEIALNWIFAAIWFAGFVLALPWLAVWIVVDASAKHNSKRRDA